MSLSLSESLVDKSELLSLNSTAVADLEWGVEVEMTWYGIQQKQREAEYLARRVGCCQSKHGEQNMTTPSFPLIPEGQARVTTATYRDIPNITRRYPTLPYLTLLIDR